MECCANFFRTWEETRNGRFPPSDHAPSCSNYKPLLFKRVSLDGMSLIDTPENVNAYLESCDETDCYKIEDIYLTQDQFDKLGEFTGF